MSSSEEEEEEDDDDDDDDDDRGNDSEASRESDDEDEEARVAAAKRASAEEEEWDRSGERLDTPAVVADGYGDADGAGSSSSAQIKSLIETGSLAEIRHAIAQLCSAIMADPTKALKRRRASSSRPASSMAAPLPKGRDKGKGKGRGKGADGKEEGKAKRIYWDTAKPGPDIEDDGPRLADLFDFIRSTRHDVCELAILSSLLVFKDIIPGYRIRADISKDGTQLKKSTKRMIEFERGLLHNYQLYLQFLEKKIKLGLGNPRKAVSNWTEEESLGLSALRCECELVRACPHFNFRNVLLMTIVSRGAQPDPNVSGLCVDTMNRLFDTDPSGEISYECVKLMCRVMDGCQYNVEEPYFRCFDHVKLQTKADDAKKVVRNLKKERRKRRRQDDAVDHGLAEADTKSVGQRRAKFQADSLHEICLVYFRVVKRKVGFALLPAALHGLGRITHLVNLETVEDLLEVMKNMVNATAATELVTAEVRVLCVHCALKTLSGAGRVLSFDPTIFVESARELLADLPAGFNNWPVILECVDLCVIKRDELRMSTVEGFIRLLLAHSCAFTGPLAATILCLAHSILIRYPRLRNSMRALRRGGAVVEEEDDEYGDVAMAVFREEERALSVAPDADGSWCLPLLCLQFDPIVGNRAKTVGAREIAPMPVRLEHAKAHDGEEVSDELVRLFMGLPKQHQSLKSKVKPFADKSRGKKGGKKK